MITEDYVSLETSKLLKEKGFNEGCRQYWYRDNLIFARGEIWNRELDNYEEEGWSAPTLQTAMKWLREVHSLYIDIVTSFSQDGICYTFSCFNVMDLIQGTKGTSYHEYQTYEEACEAAIRYCLENLI